MDFVFGPQNNDKTTCLLHLANQFILNNNIKPNNGYILLFTPPHSENPKSNEKSQIKNGYNFVQCFTNYAPQYKDNIDLIKCYILSGFEKSCGLINNFRLISKENKGLKLVLIDDLMNIIRPWIYNILTYQKKSKAKKEEFFIIQNQIIQYFLTQISLLQKSYQIPCFITINIDRSDKINYSKNASGIYNAIFPFVRNCFLFHKLNEENQIDFEEIKLAFNMRTMKIDICEIKQNENDEQREQLFNEFEIKKDKKSKNKIKINELVNDEWIKDSIGDFIECFNKYKIKEMEMEKKKKEEEEASLSQMDNKNS